MSWRRENIPRLKLDKPWKWLLIPGFAIQWIMYMFPEGGFAQVVQMTRQARSPVFTYFFSIAFWSILLAIVIALATDQA